MTPFCRSDSGLHSVRLRRGFSLIELLVVVGIMGLLAVLAVPAMQSVLSGSQIQQGASMVTQALNAARQEAMTRNRRVEVRFYISQGSNSRCGWLQTFLMEEDGSARPLGRVVRLPESIGINRSATLSSLLTSVPDKQWTSKDPWIPVSSLGTSYTAKAIQFRPDGTTSLDPKGNWFLTVVPSRDNPTATSPPPNFITAQIDPVSGVVRVFQP